MSQISVLWGFVDVGFYRVGFVGKPPHADPAYSEHLCIEQCHFDNQKICQTVGALLKQQKILLKLIKIVCAEQSVSKVFNYIIVFMLKLFHKYSFKIVSELLFFHH